MFLKRYQQKALDTLKDYLKELKHVGTKYAFMGITNQPYNSEFFGDVVTPSNSGELNSHVHEWRTFKRKDNAIPLWIDCLSCNAREVKASLRGTYSRYQFTLPIEERDHNKQVTYTK